MAKQKTDKVAARARKIGQNLNKGMSIKAAVEDAYKGAEPKAAPKAPEPDNDDVATALTLILDQVDYTEGNCALNEMVGAVLPREIIQGARRALAAHKAGTKKAGT